MDDYFELFERILKNECSNENLHKDLVLVEKSIQEEVELLRKSVEKYQTHIRNLVNNDEFGLTETYLKLKENHKLLQYRNKELENKIEAISTNSTIDIENLKQQYDNQLAILKNEYKEKIENLEQRNQELLTELHMIQATSAVELDETEKNLKQQLNEINLRLRDELKSSQTLRNDLRLLKEEYEQYKNWNNKKIMDLRRQLEYTKEQNKLLQIKSDLQNQLIDMDSKKDENSPQEDSSDFVDNLQLNKPSSLYLGSKQSSRTIAGTTKTTSVLIDGGEAMSDQDMETKQREISKDNYKEINQNTRREDCGDFVAKPQFKKPTPLYRGSKKSWKTTYGTIKTTPALIECSEAKSDQVKKSGKKRKLFNRDDFSHLEME